MRLRTDSGGGGCTAKRSSSGANGTEVHKHDSRRSAVIVAANKMAELVSVLEARGYGQEMLPSSGTGDALEEALCREVDVDRRADEVRWVSGQTFEVSI